jgi:hypothetical protein
MCSTSRRARPSRTPERPALSAGYAIQLARADGLRVIADAAPRDERLVKELGADIVLPRGDDFPTAGPCGHTGRG